MNDYMNITKAAAQWGLTPRRLQALCKSHAIPGAVRFGRAWMIPQDAPRPLDGRTRQARALRPPDDGLPHLPMPRKNPFLVHTDLYRTPGTADAVTAALEAEQPEAARLMAAQFAYLRGDTDAIDRDAAYFLQAHSGLNAVIGAGSILAKCAIWRGDAALWRKARQHMYEAPCRDDKDRQACLFWLAVSDGSLHDTSDFPDWFKRGMFDCLPADAYCLARVLYVKYLLIVAHDLASGKITLPNVEGLGLLRTLPYIIEPMISQAKIEHTLLPEIYLRLMAATVYHDLGDNARAIPHLDTAIALSLPDRLYNCLVEHRRGLDMLLDDRLVLVDAEALRRVRELYARMNVGWIHLHNTLLDRTVSATLTMREREVAKMAAFGYGNAEIAAILHIELSSVKRYIFSAMNKVGAERRRELGQYI